MGVVGMAAGSPPAWSGPSSSSSEENSSSDASSSGASDDSGLGAHRALAVDAGDVPSDAEANAWHAGAVAYLQAVRAEAAAGPRTVSSTSAPPPSSASLAPQPPGPDAALWGPEGAPLRPTVEWEAACASLFEARRAEAARGASRGEGERVGASRGRDVSDLQWWKRAAFDPPRSTRADVVAGAAGVDVDVDVDAVFALDFDARTRLLRHYVRWCAEAWDPPPPRGGGRDGDDDGHVTDRRCLWLYSLLLGLGEAPLHATVLADVRSLLLAACKARNERVLREPADRPAAAALAVIVVVCARCFGQHVRS